MDFRLPFFSFAILMHLAGVALGWRFTPVRAAIAFLAIVVGLAEAANLARYYQLDGFVAAYFFVGPPSALTSIAGGRYLRRGAPLIAGVLILALPTFMTMNATMK